MKFVRLLKANSTYEIDKDWTEYIENENGEETELDWNLSIGFSGNKVDAEYDSLDTGVGISRVKVTDEYFEDIKINYVYNNTENKVMSEDWIKNNEDSLIELIESTPVSEIEGEDYGF